MKVGSPKAWIVRTSIPLALILAGAGHQVADSRDLRRTFEFAEGELREVRVDNLFGEIVVLGHDEPEVGMKVRETVSGRDQQDIERARREVALQIDARRGVLDLYVDGPFRCQDRRSGCWDGSDDRRWDRRYRVVYDFELRVPHGARVDLKTVDEGDIRIVDVHGGFHAANVTGALDLRGLRGEGEGTTVSAGVLAAFDRPPSGPVVLSSVSDDVELVVPAGTGADLRLRSRWGEIWTDFILAAVNPPPPIFEKRGSKLIVRADLGPVARLGAGGPLISLESLSGDVYLRSAAR